MIEGGEQIRRNHEEKGVPMKKRQGNLNSISLFMVVVMTLGSSFLSRVNML